MKKVMKGPKAGESACARADVYDQYAYCSRITLSHNLYTIHNEEWQCKKKI